MGRCGGQKLFFLQSCLLLLLHRRSSYGYSLIEDLQEFGFSPGQMDISILYRTLRELEMAELVISSWDENSRGPQRRMYTITPRGEETLAQWIAALRQRRQEIERLEAAYLATSSKTS